MEELVALYDSLGFAAVNWELVLRIAFQVMLLASSAVFSVIR